VESEKPATREYRLFLAKRFREIAKSQPELRELRRILLKLGGVELVPSPGNDPIVDLLIEYGIVYSGPVVLKQGGHSGQDCTLGRIWTRRLYGIVGIGTGFALADDGLWREHSFGVLREGVLETMIPKQKYFGLLLVSEAADVLAETLIKKHDRNGVDHSALALL
jgi:hypothetical protein